MFSKIRIGHEIISIETQNFKVFKVITYFYEENIEEIVDTRFYTTPCAQNEVH